MNTILIRIDTSAAEYATREIQSMLDAYLSIAETKYDDLTQYRGDDIIEEEEKTPSAPAGLQVAQVEEENEQMQAIADDAPNQVPARADQPNQAIKRPHESDNEAEAEVQPQPKKQKVGSVLPLSLFAAAAIGPSTAMDISASPSQP